MQLIDEKTLINDCIRKAKLFTGAKLLFQEAGLDVLTFNKYSWYARKLESIVKMEYSNIFSVAYPNSKSLDQLNKELMLKNHKLVQKIVKLEHQLKTLIK